MTYRTTVRKIKEKALIYEICIKGKKHLETYKKRSDCSILCLSSCKLSLKNLKYLMASKVQVNESTVCRKKKCIREMMRDKVNSSYEHIRDPGIVS